MKHLIILPFVLLLLSACIFYVGPTYVPVGQAALRNDKLTTPEAVAYLEPLLAARGFRSDVASPVPFGSKKISRSYDGPLESSANIVVEKGCISFLILVKEGSKNSETPRHLFNQVIDQLQLDNSWQIKQGEVC